MDKITLVIVHQQKLEARTFGGREFATLNNLTL
jgi:hypothetical protein